MHMGLSKTMQVVLMVSLQSLIVLFLADSVSTVTPNCTVILGNSRV